MISNVLLCFHGGRRFFYMLPKLEKQLVNSKNVYSSFQLVFDVDLARHVSVCKKKLHCLDLHGEIITTKLRNA